jgi:hypothetical protein
MCNTTFLNHKDFEFKVKDLVWNTKIEGQVGEIYFKDSNFIFGRNCDSTFVVISPDNGSIVTTLNPYLVEKERVCLIIDGTGENKGGYSLYNVPVDNRRYSKVTLKMIDRQYRGDTETSYLIVNTLKNKEFTILFNRRQFPSISDITYFKEGKFILKYNVEAGSISRNLAAAGTGDKKYMVNIGLFDLEKIINK